MIKIRTCLVLGAGASAPYGFLAGRALVEKIVANAAKPNHPLNTALKGLGYSRERLGEFVSKLHGSQLDSIDAFLSNQPEYSGEGKAAIAAVLMQQEIIENLRSANSDQTDHWYRYLWNHLASHGRDGFQANRLRIVTFNYDRSLEQFLRDAFSDAFGCSPEDAETELHRIPITHVHGQLGELSTMALDRGRPYSPDVTEQTLRIGANGIVVIPEANKTHETAAEFVRNAKQVVFLGFAYLESNMRRLGIGDRDGENHVTQLFTGSGYNFTDRECERMRKKWRMEMDQLRSLDYLRERVDLE